MSSKIELLRRIRAIYFLGFLFSVHAVLPVYISSTFLSTITAESYVGLIYTVASLLSAFSFLTIIGFLKRFGNYKVMRVLLILELLAFSSLATIRDPDVIIASFILMLVTSALISFNLDIFLDRYSENKTTGSIRGSFLSIVNTAWIITPLIVSFILTDGDYWKIYALGAVLLLPIWFLTSFSFRDFVDAKYNHTALINTIREVFHNQNIYKIMISNILLNFFFAWMVIYMPIYLHNHIGLPWNQIGIVFTIMLVPFVLLEAPLGRLADRWLGEKEILTLGFIIVSLSTVAISFVTSNNMWIWAGMLFLTRIGASMVEIMNETYFFKNTKNNDPNILSLFRMTRPISYVIAPIIASFILPLSSLGTLFVILGMITLYGLRYSLTIEDTR